MLRKRHFLFTALIVLSLIAIPTGAVQAANDAYEPDNNAAQAKLITSGSQQTHSIGSVSTTQPPNPPNGDVDWMKFQITVSSAVLLETSGPLNSDTRIRLYSGPQTQIEISDDEGPGLFSRIDRMCGDDPLPPGTYFVTVEEYGQNLQIQSYDIFFKSSPCPAEVVDMIVGPELKGSSLLTTHESTRRSLTGVNHGPVQIINTGPSPLMASERVIYKVGGVPTSFTEMMGLPNSQVDTTFWFPWYNNLELDTQLRIANLGSSTATINVTIGGVPKPAFNLGAGVSTRVSYPGVSAGPVVVQGTENLVVSERVIYKVNNVNTSFSEMMGLPTGRLDSNYWLPWYNNVDLDTQLRIANVGGSTATINVTIGGVPKPAFNLGAGVSTRVSYPGVNAGPVHITSNEPIIAAERVIFKVNNVNTSFSEMMALTSNQLEFNYWLPWYNNVDLDTQLRIANVGGSTATINVTIGGISKPAFNLEAGVSTRVSYAGVNAGPVKITSNQPIVAAERVIYKVNNVNTSFSELMALPDSQLNSVFWLPWYNNVEMDTQLRFGIP